MKTFLSYVRQDGTFALAIAKELKTAGVELWIDQLDIPLAERWDRAIQRALTECPRMLVILSPFSVESENVMDEVNFALEAKKQVIPLFYKDCEIPFRIKRLQYADFRENWEHGMAHLLSFLEAGRSSGDGDLQETKQAASAYSAPVSGSRPARADKTRDDGRNGVVSGLRSNTGIEEKIVKDDLQLERPSRPAPPSWAGGRRSKFAMLGVSLILLVGGYLYFKPPQPILEVIGPVRLKPGATKRVPILIRRGGPVDVRISSLTPNWDGFSGVKGAPGQDGLYVGICTAEPSNPCINRQLGLGENLRRVMPSGPGTVTIFNFGSSPVMNFTLNIGRP